MTHQQILIELRAAELFSAHYAARPHITTRDYSSLEFYRRVAADEAAGSVPDLEATRKQMGGGFN